MDTVKKRKPAARRKPKASVVSGMPDGSSIPSTGDDIEAAYNFVKKQKRRTSPK